MRPPVKDLFSKQSSLYAKFRPKYPEDLFQYFASLTPNHMLAWDVGTGNGQAAVELAKHYEIVVATDTSAAQLALAPQLPNVTYAVTPQIMTADEVVKLVGTPGSVDLITVAQAVHWFEFESFYSHVRMLLRKPGGVFAAWTYGLPEISSDVDSVMQKFYKTTHAFFEPQRKYIDEKYETLPFYLDPLPPHEGTYEYETPAINKMTCEDFLGYLESWSAVNTAREKGEDILDEKVKAEFRKAWGDPAEVKDVKNWLYMRVGYARSDL
eukprot:TRINITY_DN23584_c0_g1_i1.p1 TRINITY_DN23584_c0_g1~~TRINITY_DN23584_c0_g1_i1.p1  ORF type:complete len:267 (-),score=59.44 TRINITY_DN23584_c0_g1_i1:235-1035(-)